MGKDTSTHVDFEGSETTNGKPEHTAFKAENSSTEKNKNFNKRRQGRRRRKSSKQITSSEQVLITTTSPEQAPDTTTSITTPTISASTAPTAAVLTPTLTPTHTADASAPLNVGAEESFEDAALHQRAKALGLPDSLEPQTPMAIDTPHGWVDQSPIAAEISTSNDWVDVGIEAKTEDETAQQAITSELQEAAVHQRAKALGLPDEIILEQSVAPTPPPTPHISEDVLPNTADLFKEDSSMALDSDVVTLHVVPEVKVGILGQKVQVIKSKILERRNSIGSKLLERRNSLEESGHNARLKIDAALEKKFGAQAAKVQAEIEKARLSAISDTARIAELLQIQLGQCASDLRDQQQEQMIVADPLLAGDNAAKAEISEDVEAKEVQHGDNVVAERVLEVQQGFEETVQAARHKIDDALEHRFGNQAEKLQFEVDKARDSALDETARAAELLQEGLGKCASSFREQLDHGVAPNYH